MGVDKYGRADYDYKAVFLTDSKVHEMPETAKPGQIALIQFAILQPAFKVGYVMLTKVRKLQK